MNRGLLFVTFSVIVGYVYMLMNIWLIDFIRAYFSSIKVSNE